MAWKHKIKIKHLLNEREDHETVQSTMNAIADILDKEVLFRNFNTKKFRQIPQGDDVISACDYANKLLSRMYDYADQNHIWIE